jgi:hypothetical protein
MRRNEFRVAVKSPPRSSSCPWLALACCSARATRRSSAAWLAPPTLDVVVIAEGAATLVVHAEVSPAHGVAPDDPS